MTGDAATGNVENTDSAFGLNEGYY